jgi:hypothetical protein
MYRIAQMPPEPIGTTRRSNQPSVESSSEPGGGLSQKFSSAPRLTGPLLAAASLAQAAGGAAQAVAKSLCGWGF